MLEKLNFLSRFRTPGAAAWGCPAGAAEGVASAKDGTAAAKAGTAAGWHGVAQARKRIAREKKSGNDEKRSKPTFTKVLVPVMLFIGVAGGFMPYVLSAFGLEPAESLGIAWITEVVAVVLGYLCKSYFETKQEGIQKVEEHKAGMDAKLADDGEAMG